LVLVETDVEWSLEDFTAIAVYSDMERTGFFHSSNELLNQFVENTVWSAKNNFLDIPTDCPTRERHGWTGDIQIFYKTAQYLMDCQPFIKKYLKDVYDLQYRNGNLPQIAPYGGTDFYMKTMDGSVGWSDVGILIPYRMWKLCGDRAVIEQYYDRMKKFAEFEISRIGKDYVVNKGQSYGEWAEPKDVHEMDWTDMSKPHPEVGTAYTSYVLGIMSEIATELGYEQDAQRYKEYSEKVKLAYQNLRTLPPYSLETKRQAELVRPLYMKLLNEKQTRIANKQLIKVLEDYGWRLGTGFLSTPLILYVLAEIDIEYAYKLLNNEEMPGWLFMPKNGATTIWESWEGDMDQTSGIASMNHYSKGACVEWLFTTMCGINVAGENHFEITPCPGGDYEYAGARFYSIYGMVEAGWKLVNGKYEYSIKVPSNCTATIKPQDGTIKEVAAGEYNL
jgi:alpha-L-rhamnosidase